MEKTFLIIICVVFFGCFYRTGVGQTRFDDKLKSLYKNTVPVIHAEILYNRVVQKEKIVLLDIRSREEFAVSHIRDARFIDYKNFKPQHLDTLNHNTPIVVYCTVGYRSERVGESLIAMGFKDVRNLYGGIFEWVNKGYPIVDANGNDTIHVHTYNKNWSQWLLRGVKVY